MVRFLLLAALALTLDAQVKINEVLFYDDPSSPDAYRTHQWLELYNAGTDPVDLTGWSVSGADGGQGSSARPLPAAILPAGGYLVVHFTSGENRLDFEGNSGDYYTGDAPDTPFWSVDADEAALYSPDTIVDFINWASSTVAYVPGQAEQDAVAAGIWSDGAVLRHDQIGAERAEMLRAVTPGDSIGRSPFSFDSDAVTDFNPLGGESSLGPTPGRQNLDQAPMAPAQLAQDRRLRRSSGRTADAPPNAKWTVLVYMSADNNLEGYFLRKLCRLQQAGGSTADVNFVVMLDLKNMPDPVSGVTTTYRGLVQAPAMAQVCNNGAFTINPGITDIGERDMGDPTELSGFIAWGKENYPADRYGLVLTSHGAGWKNFGPDETFPQGTREKVDRLYMGELSSALSGQTFDWIAFDACLMAAVEVAHQLKPYASYLLASEEVSTTGDFPYEALAQDLAANPDWNALDSITDVFNQYTPRASVNQPAQYTVSVLDLTQVNDLSLNIRAWADLLAPGMSLFQKRDDPADNVQILTGNQLRATERFSDKNFIDLYDFTDKMRTSGLPKCLLSPVQSILDTIKNRKNKVVLLEAHGPGHPHANGVHIYFPLRRMVNIRAYDTSNQPYDLPLTRTVDGSSSYAHYGVNHDQLPLKARDPETGVDFDLPGNGLSIVWPLPQSPGFLFPNDTGWDKVLDRYYHPAADNHILPVRLPDGTVIMPTEVGGGACVNPTDSIVVPVGTSVTFSAKGSSDADQPSGNVPSYYFWDLDSRVPCLGDCRSPYEVADPVTAPTNMDADRDIALTTTDQNDAQGVTTSLVCDSGTITVTLMPWDDDHMFQFHNTQPEPAYVHPQSSTHPATMSCTPTGTLFPTTGTIDLTFTVTDDPFISAMYVALTSGMVTFTTTDGPKGAREAATGTITITGDRAQLPNGTGVYDPAAGVWNATILAPNLIAGFPNVEVKWVNMKFTGPGNNTLTGTYQVGTNGNLNGESKPVVYSVTGTVTRK